MSTKIFNGYLIKNMTLLELQQFTLDVRGKLNDIYEGLYHKRIADLCCQILDSRSLKSKEGFFEEIKSMCEKTVRIDAPMFIAQRVIREHQRRIKSTQERDPFYDFGCEMVIIPIKGKILMLLYAEQSAYREAIESLPEVSEYSYWDNTDMPENISKAQWEQREDDWGIAMRSNGLGIPSMCGFTVNCILEDYLMIDPEDIVGHIPDFKERVERLASRSVMNKYYAAHIKPENIMKAHLDAVKHLENEGKAEIKEEKKRIAGLLKKKYTRKDILGDISLTA